LEVSIPLLGGARGGSRKGFHFSKLVVFLGKKLLLIIKKTVRHERN